MKSEINLYDKDMNFIKTFKSVEECAEFFYKDKNYIHHNLKYRDKIRKDDKWYKIRKIIIDEKQQEIDRLNNIIKDLKKFLYSKYDEWKDSENDNIRESAYEDLRILNYIEDVEKQADRIDKLKVLKENK